MSQLTALPHLESLIAQAVQAPSGHNTQPWLFHCTGDDNHPHIEIRPDMRRALPVVDADGRELFASLGCAAENLCIAAAHMGYHTSVRVDEASGHIHIGLRPQAPAPQPLFAQIGQRQTNRSLYSGTLDATTLATLQNTPAEPGVRLHFFARGTPAFEQLTAFVCEGNTRQMSNHAFKAELKSWLRYNKKHQDATRDGLSYAVFGAPNVPRCIAKAVMGSKLNAQAQNRADRARIDSSSHLVLLTTAQHGPRQWVDLGRTLQRLLLQATALGVAHAYLNQPCEERELARAMAAQLGLQGEHPALLLRLGYARPRARSLRRAVADVLVP